MSDAMLEPAQSWPVGDWLRWIGQVREEKGVFNALAAVDQALAVHADSDELLTVKGELQAFLGQVDEAEISLQAALERQPDNPVAMLRLARVRVLQGQFESAKTLARAALAKKTKKASVDSHAALIFFHTGDYPAAARALVRLVMHAPSPGALEAHDQVMAALAEDAEAGIAPRFRSVYTRALERLRERDAKAAETLLRKLVQYCPAYGPGWIALRGSLLAQSRDEEAKAVRDQWRAAAPKAGPRVDPGFARVLGARGLLFDPRDRFPLVGMDQVMARAGGPEDLKRPGDSCCVIDPGGELIEHDPVVSLDGRGQDQVRVSFRSAPKFVAAVDNAALAGEGIVVDAQGRIVKELLPPVKLEKLGARVEDDAVVCDPFRFNDGLCPVKFHDAPAFLMMGPTDRSFGDWMINIPPRLLLAEAAGLDCPIVIRSEPRGQVLAILNALGVNKSRILFHDPQGVSVFPRLYASSWPTADKHQPSRGVYDVYRRAALSAETGPRRLLYLSRANVKGSRQMLNEPEVCELFSRRGFQIVDPGALSFQEVRSLFAGAACVAGPFGSAFHNLAFCSARPVNLVLMPSNNPYFLTEIALWHGELGQRFVYVLGQSLDDDVIGRHDKHAPWLAPLDKLDQAIDRVLAEVEAERGSLAG